MSRTLIFCEPPYNSNHNIELWFPSKLKVKWWYSNMQFWHSNIQLWNSIMQFWHSNIQLWYSYTQFWHSNISLCTFDIRILHYAVLTFKYSLYSFENQSSIALLKYAYMITVGTGNRVLTVTYPITAFETEFDIRIFIFNLEVYLFILTDTQWPVFGVKPSRAGHDSPTR